MNPTPAGGPPLLDRALAALGRFTPGAGFERRVLARVRVPLPAWARGVRNWFRGMTSGARGWALLGSMSIATAGVWVLGIGAGLQFSDYVTKGSRILTSEVLPAAWSELLAQAASQRDAVQNSVSGALGALGVSWQALALGYGLIVVVSAVALRLLMTRRVRVRG